MFLIPTDEGPLEWIAANPSADPEEGSYILLHGIQGTAATWNDVSKRLGNQRAIVMPNLRGRGASFAPIYSDAYTLEKFASDLRAVIAKAPKPITLVAWSMGVLVSLSYLAQFGSHGLNGLVLASGTANPRGEAIWFKAVTLEDVAHEARERAIRLALTSYATPEAVAGAWASVRGADLIAGLPAIDLPTLVLHGELDDQCPVEHGSRIAAGIPRAYCEIWLGGGHNLMAEDPERFAQAIMRLNAAAR